MSIPDREHVLLTALGVNSDPAVYAWDGRKAEARVATAALYRLLPESQRPHRIVALCTEQAEAKTLPVLREAVASSCPIEVVRISADPTGINDCLTALARSVPSDADLTVDVTHGFRHMPFLIYAGVLYLTALRRVRLRGAYYGMLDRSSEISPFLDLRPLVELPSWFYGVRVFAETGNAGVIADIVAAADGEEAPRVGAELRALSEAYASGLPIELGYLARRFLADKIGLLESVLHAERLPMAGELVQAFVTTLEGQQIDQDLPEQRWKEHATLTRSELERQARLIDGYLDRQNFAIAFGMMREWLVLWQMWRTGEDVAHWLDYRKRKKVEDSLRSLKCRFETSPEVLDPAERAAGEVWGHLTSVRNSFAHHGLERSIVLSREEGLRQHVVTIERIWRETLRAVPKPGGSLLVSPLGTRPGVLYSALLAADPQRVTRCLVICSAATEGPARQACRAAGYTGDVEFLRFDDPFAGVREIQGLVKRARRRAVDATEIYVNITGGTTLMGVLADRIATAARCLGQPTYQFVLIDRRPPAEQESDPFQQGEVCWLDDEPQGE